MNTHLKISVKAHLTTREIYFGIPSSQQELNKMYDLRFRVYHSHGYLSEGATTDLDEYDNKSTYFIAKIGDAVLGSVRLIRDNILPTEKDCFAFIEPENMQTVPRSKRGEISRLVIERTEATNFLPRHLIMLGLIKCLAEYCSNNNIQGGYGFIKDKLKNKLDRVSFPVHYIRDYDQVYNKEILKNYFNDKKDKVWPIYYFTDEVSKYINSFFNNKFFFVKIEPNSYFLKNFNWKMVYISRRIIWGLVR